MNLDARRIERAVLGLVDRLHVVVVDICLVDGVDDLNHVLSAATPVAVMLLPGGSRVCLKPARRFNRQPRRSLVLYGALAYSPPPSECT